MSEEQSLSVTVKNITEAEYDYADSSLSDKNKVTIAVSDSLETLGVRTKETTDYSPFWEKRLNSIRFGNGIIQIEDYSCYKCSNLLSVVIPSNCLSIGIESFSNCSNLNYLFIEPKLVNYIGDKAFYKTGFTDLNYSVFAEEVGNEIFSNCTELTSLTLKTNLIGKEMFKGCSHLNKVTIENLKTEDINWMDEEDKELGYKSIIVANEGVFSGCYVLHDVFISPYLTYIPNKMFSGCKQLSSIVFDDSIQYLTFDDLDRPTNSAPGFGDEVFSGCTALNTITLPERYNWNLWGMFSNNTFKDCNYDLSVKFEGLNSEQLGIMLGSDRTKYMGAFPLYYSAFEDSNEEGIVDISSSSTYSDCSKYNNIGYKDFNYKYKCGRFYSADCFADLFSQAFEKRLPFIMFFSGDKNNSEVNVALKNCLKSTEFGKYMMDANHPFYWCWCVNNTDSCGTDDDGILSNIGSDFYTMEKSGKKNQNDKTIELDSTVYPWSEFGNKKSKGRFSSGRGMPTFSNVPAAYYDNIEQGDGTIIWKRLQESDMAYGKLDEKGKFNCLYRTITEVNGIKMISRICGHYSKLIKSGYLNINRINLKDTQDLVIYIFYNGADIDGAITDSDLKSVVTEADLFADFTNISGSKNIQSAVNRCTNFSTKTFINRLDDIIKNYLKFDVEKYKKYISNITKNKITDETYTDDDKMSFVLFNKTPSEDNYKADETPTWFGFNLSNNLSVRNMKPKFTSSDDVTFYFHIKDDLSSSYWDNNINSNQ